MNKVVNINLNGIIISIDEQAFGKLKSYIDALHKHFAGTEGSAEIISDIETRIAELLQLRLSASYTVIQEADVAEVIGIMGNPGQMDAGHEDEAAQEEKPHAAAPAQPKKLRRDTRNKILGGVCSGMANYMNMDPVFIRGLFCIALFIYGTGFLFYALLWIAMPKARPGELPEFSEPRSKRLFRSEDEKMLGGVCAGAGNYFGIDPVWLRLLFLVALVFYGSGFLLYVVLWIIIPKAVTVAQKLQMKGEPVDVNNIERMIRNTLGTGPASQPAGFLNNLVSLIGQLFKFLFSAAGKIIGLALVFASLALLVGLIAGTFFHNERFDSLIRLFVLSDEIELYARWGETALVVSIILGFMALAYRLLFSTKLKLRYIGLVNTVLCIAGITLIIIAAVKYSIEVRSGQHVIDRTYLYPVSDTMYIDMNPQETDRKGIMLSIDDDRFEFHNGHRYPGDFNLVFTSDAGKLLYNGVRMFIKPSLTDSIEVKVKKEARGRNKEEARKNAADIRYTINRENNRLIFGRGIMLDSELGYRYQEVHVTLAVPVGTVLVMRNGMNGMLRGLDYDMWDGTVFKVTADGLVCLDCDFNKEDRHDHIIYGEEDEENEDKRIRIEINGNDKDTAENVRVIIESTGDKDSVVKITQQQQKIGPVTIQTEKKEKKKIR